MTSDNADDGGHSLRSHYGPLFDACAPHRQWFVVIEALSALLFGVLGGAVADDEATCNRLLIAATVACAIFLLLALLRPYDTWMDMTMFALNGSLSVSVGIVAVVHDKLVLWVNFRTPKQPMTLRRNFAKMIPRGESRVCSNNS